MCSSLSILWHCLSLGLDWKLTFSKFADILSAALLQHHLSGLCSKWANLQNPSESESHSVMSDSLQPHGPYSSWNSLGQNTGVGSLSLLQGIFPTQGLNPGLPNCRQILYQLSHKGRSRILEWVAYPFSSGSSLPRKRTGVSFIAGRFFTNWAMREESNIGFIQKITI